MKLFKKKDDPLYLLKVISVFFAVLPFAIYFIERVTGVLPSAEVYWQTWGGNHGPWRWEFESMFIFYPQLILFFAIAIKMMGQEHLSEKYFLRGFALICFQVAVIFLHMWILFWTID